MTISEKCERVLRAPKERGSDMTRRNYMRVSGFIVWRAFQAGVVIPATITGALVLWGALSGVMPVRATLEGFYGYAEEMVRPAAPGHVLVTVCLPPRQLVDSQGAPVVLCEETETREVPVETVIEGWLRMLSIAYTVLVALSGLFVVLAYPGRRFIGLPPRDDEPPVLGTGEGKAA